MTRHACTAHIAACCKIASKQTGLNIWHQLYKGVRAGLGPDRAAVCCCRSDLLQPGMATQCFGRRSPLGILAEALAQQVL